MRFLISLFEKLGIAGVKTSATSPPQDALGCSSVVVSGTVGTALSVDTCNLSDISLPFGDPLADPWAVANLAAVVQQTRELPIGRVPNMAVAHVKVDLQGGCSLNGKQVSHAELQEECCRLREVSGIVLYFREHPERDPPSEAESVIAAICDAHLPVTFVGCDFDSEVPVADYLATEKPNLKLRPK